MCTVGWPQLVPEQAAEQVQWPSDHGRRTSVRHRVLKAHLADCEDAPDYSDGNARCAA